MKKFEKYLNESKMKMMTYGELPRWSEFRKHVEMGIDPETDKPWLSSSEKYPYNLKGSDAQAARKAGIPTSGKFDLKKIYQIISKLKEEWENGNDSAGDLASSFMYTLGFEWV